MKANCFQIGEDRQIIPCSYEQAVELATNPDARVWIDVQGIEDPVLEGLLNKLGVRDLARRLCIDARQRSGFYPLNSYIFMVIPIKADNERDVEYVSILCNKHFMLSLRSVRETRIQQITNREEASDWLEDTSIEGLLATVMMILSLDSMQHLSELRDHITALENRLDRDHEHVSISELSDIRFKLLTLETVVSGQLPALTALMATDKPFFRLVTAREYLASAQANVLEAERLIHSLMGRLESVRSDLEMRSQANLNRRLNRLTILSAIFMPITFLAGVWGMNFVNMPALNLPYGYLVAIGVMFFIGGGMFLYFNSKGWFK
jgi:magnesium transporter